MKSLLDMHLDLEADPNYVTRNSNCNFGGDNLTIYVNNPRDTYKFITGIKITLIPNVPDQDLGKTQYFDRLEYYEDFDPVKKGVEVTYPVVPEYSYLVSVAFNTEYGSLTPSDNVTSKGEFERMMGEVGCYIRNDFYFKNSEEFFANSHETFQNTSIDCANACSEDLM